MTEAINDQLGTTDVLWDLGCLYTGPADPRVETDIEACLSEAKSINTRYAGRVSVLSAEELFDLVQGLENLAVRKAHLGTFAFLNFTTQTDNQDAGAFLQRLREIASQVSRQTVFFELEWTKLDEAQASILLDAPCLGSYRHYLHAVRRYAPHMLSQAEETLLIEIAPVGRGAWTLLFEKIMGGIKFGPRQRTEEEVLADLYSPERDVRRQAATDLTAGLSSQLHVLTHITNTLLADKMIDDRLRRYPSWDRSMHLHNELEDQTVEALIAAVTSRYDIPRRYYEFKKRLLGVDELFDYDRYAPLPDLAGNAIPWDECRTMVLEAFAGFSSDMAAVAERFFAERWIHAPILAGKRGGAFAHPCTPDRHPFLLVNYTGNLRDVSTVAHELGHGVHQVLAAERGYFNSDTPLVLAETASVFAELVVFNSQLSRLTDAAQKTAFIAQKLESIFATVFRQVAMNRFEHASHTGRRDRGELSSEDLSRIWLATQNDMFQGSVTLTTDYGIWWSYIPHFLNSPGYVYSYAFGELLVLSLYRLHQKDPARFVPLYLDLLRAGGSLSPYDSLRPFDIDLNDPEFWHGGLAVIDGLLSQVLAD